MIRYPDTSFLFSYFGSDVNSRRADVWRRTNPVPLPFTVLHRLELRNAFELAVFQQRLTAHAAAETWLTIESDLGAGIMVQQNLTLSGLFAEAEQMSARHTATTGARSLDVLHVAAAVLLGAEELVTFDQRQAALAKLVGLRVAAL